MKLALIAAAALAVAPVAMAQETVVFSENNLGLQFNHPATWKIAKRERGTTTFHLPTASGQNAELLVMRTVFRREADLWQDGQRQVNRQLQRDVVRQWEQLIMGVPMLFTRINYVENGRAVSVLTGLYYTRSQEKMWLRLTAPQAEYDNVSYEFHQAMETLRTFDGRAPLVEDPRVQIDTTTKAQAPLPPPKVLDDGRKETGAVVPPNKASLRLANRDLDVHYPDGWTAKVEQNRVTLTNPALDKPVVVVVHSTLDSDPPLRALFKLSSTTLEVMNKVDSRQDRNTAPNRAGAQLTSVWRTGTTTGGTLSAFEAVGQSGNFYFLTSYRQTNPDRVAAERRLIESLVDNLTIVQSQ
jgi:hypothetical protein